MAKLGDLVSDIPPGGRLTLTTGVPVTTIDVHAATTVYYTPYVGDKIAIYNGSDWVFHQFSELSLSLSGYTADKNYDIWIYDNAGTLTLDSTVWTNDTTRATAITRQDGVYVKSGDAIRRYLGTIRTTSTTGQCEDSKQRRLCWNFYNKENRFIEYNNATSHTYGGTYRGWNNSNIHFVEWVSGDTIQVLLHLYMRTQTGGFQVGLANSSSYPTPDSTFVPDDAGDAQYFNYGSKMTIGSNFKFGYWKYNIVEYGSGGTVLRACVKGFVYG